MGTFSQLKGKVVSACSDEENIKKETTKDTENKLNYAESIRASITSLTSLSEGFTQFFSRKLSQPKQIQNSRHQN